VSRPFLKGQGPPLLGEGVLFFDRNANLLSPPVDVPLQTTLASPLPESIHFPTVDVKGVRSSPL